MAPTANLRAAILADVTLPDSAQVGSTAFCSLSVAGSPFSQALCFGMARAEAAAQRGSEERRLGQ